MQRAATRSGAFLAFFLGACLLGLLALWRVLAEERAATARTSQAARAVLAQEREDLDGVATSATAERVPTSSGSQAQAANAASARPVPLGTVRGRVIDHLGRGIPEARVVLRERGTGASEHSVRTIDGSFRFGVEPGTFDLVVTGFGEGDDWLGPWGQDRLSLPPDDPRCAPGRFGRRLDVEAGSETGVEVLAVRAASVEGRLLGPTGEPVEGAGVRLVAVEDPGLRRDVRTASDGSFRLEGLYPGRMQLFVRLRQARAREHRLCRAPEVAVLELEEGQAIVLEALHLRPGDVVGMNKERHAGSR